MLNLKKVAVTGGISSGKSLVCHFFKEFGAYTLSADRIVHELLTSNNTLIRQVINRLGLEVANEGQLDQKRIAEKVFNDSVLLKALEEIIHPLVRKQIVSHYNYAKNKQIFPLFVVEIPLLFESGFNLDFDATLAIISDEKSCKERYKDVKEYDKRMFFQLTPSEKAEKADFIIENNGTKQELGKKVFKLFQHLTHLTQKWEK